MNANLEEVIEVVIVLFSCGASALTAAAPLMDCGVSSALWEPNNPPRSVFLLGVRPHQLGGSERHIVMNIIRGKAHSFFLNPGSVTIRSNCTLHTGLIRDSNFHSMTLVRPLVRHLALAAANLARRGFSLPSGTSSPDIKMEPTKPKITWRDRGYANSASQTHAVK
ncbi:hypothetical protein Baya_7377 [Bagarius yarrelli]|uniref:Uncharacterized protein n=1 Tax=Bagarius yarrelli TaxID=175774 RepID=A0A556U1V0_BAGYA|nr:hypothetical protein Baya_7377 [Bagarius yarrelli]